MTVVPVQEASLIRRSLAAVVDIGLSVALGGTIAWMLPGLLQDPWPPRYWNLFDYAVDVTLHHPRLWVGPLAVLLATMLAWETLWTVLLGTTPVARVLGMQVRTLSGRRPGLLRALWRSLLWMVLSVPGALGPAVGLLGRRRRTLHDILSGCLVVQLPVPARVPETDTADDTGSGDFPRGPDGRVP